jgi:hypothetical protein
LVRPFWLGLIVFLVASIATNAAAQRRPAPAPAPASGGPPGWSNPKALELAKEGIEAKKGGDLPKCVQKDSASLAFEDHPYVKLHLASCLAGMGRLRESLTAARDALAAGIRNDDAELTKAAQNRVSDLLPKLAHIKFQVPKKRDGLKVVMNGAPLRPHLYKERLTVDPGDYVIEAEREEAGEKYTFREKGTLAEGEDKVVEIILKPNKLPEGQEECLREAQTYEEKIACIEEKSTKPNVHVGLEFSGYTDNTAVQVLSPAVNAAVASPTSGWNVGGSYLIDIVSAASPDIVSMASPPFKETRHAGALGGGYKVDNVLLGLNSNVSREPDYLSITGGGSAAIELNDKLVVPRFGYSLQKDTIGIRNTPFANFNRDFASHTLEGGVTFVLSPTTLLVTGTTLKLEFGEQAKLYRFVPMFAPDVAAQVRAGESVESVNAARLNIRPREQLPRSRQRFAIGARLNHRLTPGSTLRVEERVYVDSWGIKASTTDARYLIDLDDRFRVWPHVRFHAQSGTNFYQRAYVAGFDTQEAFLVIPKYRTGDRELSPMMSLTLGGGTRIGLNSERASIHYAVVVSGEMMYSQYFDSLFIVSRTAWFGTVGLDVEF